MIKEKLEEVHTNLEESIVDLQCRSIRFMYNLLFFGLAEYRDENRETCTALINDFCETRFDIQHSGQVQLIQNDKKVANTRQSVGRNNSLNTTAIPEKDTRGTKMGNTGHG